MKVRKYLVPKVADKECFDEDHCSVVTTKDYSRLTAEEDLRIDTSCTTVTLMLQSKPTNIPFKDCFHSISDNICICMHTLTVVAIVTILL